MLVLLCAIVYVRTGDSQGERSPKVGRYANKRAEYSGSRWRCTMISYSRNLSQ